MNPVLFAGALFNLAFVAFHLFFRIIFRWDHELPLLNPINRAIMPTFNICIITVLLAFTLLSLLYPDDLCRTPLGHAMLLFIMLFWLIRGIVQLIFFRKNLLSMMMFIIFFAGAVLYAVPLIQRIGQSL